MIKLISRATLMLGVAISSAALAQGAQPPARPPFDATGVGDTSIFAPILLRPGNTYRGGAGVPGHQYWQQKADYDITAKLDTTATRLTGELTLRYTNNSSDTLR